MKNSMLKFSILVLSTIFLFGCNIDRFEGSDDIVTITRDFSDFTKIDANDDLEVNVIQGVSQQVEITISENLQSQLRTNVSNNTLNLSIENGSYTNEVFIVNIQIPVLEWLELNDNTRGMVTFTASQLEFRVNDSSELELEGSSDELDISVNDAGTINGFSFEADMVNTSSGDASELEITCNNELNGSVSDAAEVRYKGTPTVNAQTSDAGKIINAN